MTSISIELFFKVPEVFVKNARFWYPPFKSGVRLYNKLRFFQPVVLAVETHDLLSVNHEQLSG